MSDDSKKNQQKAKHDPKEQRRPRHRNQPVVADRSVEKKSESKVPVQTKPVYEEPGQECYKGLKRETDEILKITEEANSKYKKKEIQSNWSKYEMPIESYEEMEEQENMGADYEKLIQAPLSIGGHFQFKHEKSWDLNTGPSLYDNYFDINMENLASALSTIPFYERNNIEKSVFSQTDITNMDIRSRWYNDQKFYNVHSCATTTDDIEAQDKLKATVKESFHEDRNEKETDNLKKNMSLDFENIVLEKPSKFNKPRSEVVQLNNNELKEEDTAYTETDIPTNISKEGLVPSSLLTLACNKSIHDDLDDILLDAPEDNVDRPLDEKAEIPQNRPHHAPSAIKKTKDDPKESSSTSKATKNPVMESPEDLEKWLDNFLES